MRSYEDEWSAGILAKKTQHVMKDNRSLLLEDVIIRQSIVRILTKQIRWGKKPFY